jgi:hypothetical protein
LGSFYFNGSLELVSFPFNISSEKDSFHFVARTCAHSHSVVGWLHLNSYSWKGICNFNNSSATVLLLSTFLHPNSTLMYSILFQLYYTYTVATDSFYPEQKWFFFLFLHIFLKVFFPLLPFRGLHTVLRPFCLNPPGDLQSLLRSQIRIRD